MIVTITGRRPDTVNGQRRMNPYARAASDKWWRQMAWAQAHRRKVQPPTLPVHIDATPLYQTRRSLSDPGGIYPSVKAAIDGLVDAGILAGDTGQHITAITLHAPRINGTDGLELVIREVE